MAAAPYGIEAASSCEGNAATEASEHESCEDLPSAIGLKNDLAVVQLLKHADGPAALCH
jgi:hypothetical protein